MIYFLSKPCGGTFCRRAFLSLLCPFANALPTGEGAIQLAMERMPITIHGCRALVIGFGRVGQVMAWQLSALGAKVSVAARRSGPLAMARVHGYGTEQIGHLVGWLGSYDLIINTVPAPVLGERELMDVRGDCLIIDLASAPGGVDLAAAARLSRQTVWALSLPGKVAPATAGGAIRDTIYQILSELGL